VIFNASCDGRTTGWDEALLNGQVCFAATLKKHAPLDAVIIALGTNDFKAKYKVAGAEAVFHQLKRLTDVAESAGIDRAHLILASPPPMGTSAGGELRGADRMIAHLGQLIRAYCAKEAIGLLDLQAGLSVRHHLGDDHIHLNARGRKRTAKLAFAALRSLFKGSIRKDDVQHRSSH
jgi:lysophospholipase L1-like esterase